MNNTEEIDIDTLLVFYVFSDQFGNVNFKEVLDWQKNHPEELPNTISFSNFILNQDHLNLLMDAHLIPDTRLLLDKILKTGE